MGPKKANKPKNLTMRVRLVVDIEVDRDEWNAEYFSDDNAASIRDQVKGMGTDAVIGAFAHITHAVTVVS